MFVKNARILGNNSFYLKEGILLEIISVLYMLNNCSNFIGNLGAIHI